MSKMEEDSHTKVLDDHRLWVVESGSNLNLNFMLYFSGILGETLELGELGAHWSQGNYLAAFTRDAAIMVPGGFVTTHYT